MTTLIEWIMKKLRLVRVDYVDYWEWRYDLLQQQNRELRRQLNDKP